MKQADLVTLGLAAAAVFLIVKATKKTTTSTSTTSNPVTEIFNTLGKAFDNGWRYFSDGTSIDPSGNYYSGGQLIWANPSATSGGASGGWA